MNKFLISIALCMFSVSVFSQIPVIHAEQSPFEVERLTKTASISCDKQKGTYNLLVYSSNSFEKEYATISLGKSVDEVATSMVNLLDAMTNVNTYFKVGTYSFYVQDRNTINIIPSGNIESAVGSYTINSELIGIIIEWLVVRRDLYAGNDCSIRVHAIFERSIFLDVSIPKYKINKILISLESKKVDAYNFMKILQNSNEGDLLSSREISKIKLGIQSECIRNTDDAIFFQRIVDSMVEDWF